MTQGTGKRIFLDGFKIHIQLLKVLAGIFAVRTCPQSIENDTRPFTFRALCHTIINLSAACGQPPAKGGRLRVQPLTIAATHE